MVFNLSIIRLFRKLGVSLLLLNLVTGCATDDAVTEGTPDIPWTASTMGRSVGPGFTFRAGDTLELYVLEDSTLDGEYPVRQTGDVIIPRLGRVNAVGKTTGSIEAEIKRRLEQNQIKEATVIVDTPLVFGNGLDDSGRPTVEVYIYGQVAKQGLTKIPSMRGQRITCLDAVVHAGGFSTFANKKKVAIVRKTIEQGNFTVPVDLDAVEKGKAIDVELLPGDIIRVPQKTFGFGF